MWSFTPFQESGSTGQTLFGSGTPTMTTWQEPTGRERAIEALMDRDKDGDYFRVRKVMVRRWFRA